MSAPDLTIQIEPVEAQALVYASLAAKSSLDQPEGQLLLVLKITNNEPSPIEVSAVTISFVGPPNVAQSVIKPTLTPPPDPPTPLTIDAHDTREWTLLEWWYPNIILPVPAPAVIKISLSCVGFSAPAHVCMPLAQYSSPATGGGYAFPFKAADLDGGEFLTGLSSGDYHRARGYDIMVHKYESLTKQWLAFPAGADATKNESYYVWDKPVYAIADGVVAQVHNSTPDNTTAGALPTVWVERPITSSSGTGPKSSCMPTSSRARSFRRSSWARRSSKANSLAGSVTREGPGTLICTSRCPAR